MGWTNGAGGLLTAARVFSAGINAPHECANLAGEAGCLGKWEKNRKVKSFLGGLWMLLGALQDLSVVRVASNGSKTVNKDSVSSMTWTWPSAVELMASQLG